jgi:SET domain-containing protein
MITIKEKDTRFYVKESTQQDAGMGLFASVDILAGSSLEVIGVMVDRESISDTCTSYSNSYKFAADYANSLGSIKKHIIPMGFAAIVNHANEKKDQNVEIRYIKKGQEQVCVYYFIKDVKKDEEILGNYGDKWWQSIRNINEWTKKINSSDSKEEDEDWDSFLELGLYNLRNLKKYKETDA